MKFDANLNFSSRVLEVTPRELPPGDLGVHLKGLPEGKLLEIDQVPQNTLKNLQI